MNSKLLKHIIIVFNIVTQASLVLSLFLTDSSFSPAFAHSNHLEVEYDDCNPKPYININDIGDGEDEKWYLLVNNNGYSHHIPHSSNGPTEIRYYISEYSSDGLISWVGVLGNDRANYVKNAFANSILKWNNVVFYAQSGTTTIQKKKLVNIQEGSNSNYNVVIFPKNDQESIASTAAISQDTIIEQSDGFRHAHNDTWRISLDLHDHISQTDKSEAILARTGAHEFGHIMGLEDIDGLEGGSNHHEELLMGYAYGAFSTRQKNLTYKDMIGAAITRGFHTDDDHLWMYDASSSSTNSYKLICSICNGVKYVSSLANYSYVVFKACNDNHAVSSGNMFAVGSYNNYDYFKCKYCRYVAPFSDLQLQNYDKSFYDNSYHLVTNQVNGLVYYFYEEHTYDENNYCSQCGGSMHYHDYTYSYLYFNSRVHRSFCECGSTSMGAHIVDISNIHYCILCGGYAEYGLVGPLNHDEGL